MFSRRPIVVYAHPDTGIAKYASGLGLARVVSRRDCQVLTGAIRDLLTHDNEANELIGQADKTARTFHTHEANQEQLCRAITSDAHSKE